MRKKLHLSQKRIYLELGETLIEIHPVTHYCTLIDEPLKEWIFKFEKDASGNYYFSNFWDINISGTPKVYSTIGEISYFPTFKAIGINLEEEYATFGIPRYPFGKITSNLFYLKSLLPKEVGIFFGIYRFS